MAKLEEIKNLIPKGNSEDNNKDKEYLKIFKQEEILTNNLINSYNKECSEEYSLFIQNKLNNYLNKMRATIHQVQKKNYHWIIALALFVIPASDTVKVGLKFLALKINFLVWS